MKLIDKVKSLRLDLITQVYRLRKIKKNKILFWSDLGKRYSCNPRYLSEYIAEHYPDKYEIVWMFDSQIEIPDDFPKNIRIVRYFSKDFLYELATAGFIVCNCRIPLFFRFKKRKEQVYIQTWHSSLRIKSIEKDAERDLSDDYIQNAIFDSSQIDYLLSGSGFSTQIFKNSFWYSGKILEFGTPRIDYLISNASDKTCLMSRIGLSDNYKYILYAPTFRKNDDINAYNVDMQKLSAALKNRFGDEWKVLYRLHPNIADRVKLDDLPDCCINMSFYHSMQDLLIVSDILLTDYSSCMFDMMYLEKPCFLYVPDYEEYMANERKLYFDLKNLPFLFAETNEELVNRIEEFNKEDYYKKIKCFLKEINSYENGHSCERIINYIFER